MYFIDLYFFSSIFSDFLLFYLCLSPLFFGFVILFIKNDILVKKFSLFFSILIFFFSFYLFLFFDNFSSSFQFVCDLPWFLFNNIFISLGLDGFSVLFVLLTTFLQIFCVLISWNSIFYKIRVYYFLLFLIEFCLLVFFSSLDLILFYVFFESVLIPMFILIIVWGSRSRKVHAALQFFLYTLIGSVLMLLGILFIYSELGTTDITYFLNHIFSEDRQMILWLCFFIPFAVKVPMFPFHIWLPEAHVEAPTAGSVLLAGVLLKLGTYGMLRLMIPAFPFANNKYLFFVFILGILGIIYSSCATIRQIDLKKIIAYSSVAHMNFVIVGLFSQNCAAVSGSVFLMLSHGLVSSALFLCVGVLYDRYHTRNLKYYGGLVMVMPLFSILFLLFSLANIGMPGSSSFIGEFFILLGIFPLNRFVTILAGLSMVLGACYAMWLYNRIVFGDLKIKFIARFSDLNGREFSLLFPFAFLVLLIGINPMPFIDVYTLSLYKLLILY